jgi:hypothetical protein
MLLELIARYFKYLWIAFGLIAFSKIILTHFFLETLENFNGLLYSLFRWYGSNELELEEASNAKAMMQVENVLTVLMYISLVLIIVAKLLLYFFR